MVHNFLDVSGTDCFRYQRMEGAQSSAPRVRWGQRDRTAVGMCRALALSISFDAGQTQKTSAQIAAGLLFLLAAFVLVASVGSLMGHIETRPSRLGIGLLLTASVVMPWLARQKRRLSGATASASLRAPTRHNPPCVDTWLGLR